MTALPATPGYLVVAQHGSFGRTEPPPAGVIAAVLPASAPLLVLGVPDGLASYVLVMCPGGAPLWVAGCNLRRL